MTRRGFTLTELLIAMVVMGLVGTLMARILINNSRFVSRQDAMMEARATARAAMQAMMTELRMVPDSGLLIATKDSVRVSIPYAFGIACGSTSGITTGSLMPADSIMYWSATPDSIGIRSPAGGAFRRRRLISASATVTPGNCTSDSIRVIPGGWLVGLNIWGSDPASGSLFYLAETVTYGFRPSADLPGRLGLWRRVGTGAWEELAAPFDTTARFAFLMGPYLQLDSRTTLESGSAGQRRARRDSVRGLELRLTGQSVYSTPGSSAPETFDLRTRVGFMNKAYVANKVAY